MEVELKLLIDAKFKDALLRHPLLNGQAARPHEHTLSDTYFDTPDLRLHARHVGLRVRRVDGRWVQNIKSGDDVRSGLHSRLEWESPVAGPAPELTRLREVVDDKKTRREVLAAAAMGKGLAPIFTSKVKRTEWEVRPRDGEHIACALDQRRLESGGKKTAISELELALTSRDAGQLFDLALALQQDLPLHIGRRGKADGGYALFAAQVPAAVKASALTLTRRMSTEQAFQAIAFNCLSHMQDNDQGVAVRHDVESLHQMRVGMRRLRSALSMFKALLQLPADVQTDLDWLAQELGAARDWDVLAGVTLPGIAGKLADRAPLDAAIAAAAERAQHHHVAAAAAVSAARYTRLMLNMARWLQTMGWRAQPGGKRRLAAPVARFARRTLQRDQRRLRARAAGLSEATPAARHRVRIAAKKTRYAAEFFASLFARKTVRRYVKALTGLQDELGYLNDAAVAERLLAELAPGEPQLDASVGFARGYLVARIANDDQAILKLWHRFARIGMPR